MRQGVAYDQDIGTAAVQTSEDTYLKENTNRCTEALAAQITGLVVYYFCLKVVGWVQSSSQLKTILILAPQILMLQTGCDCEKADRQAA